MNVIHDSPMPFPAVQSDSTVYDPPLYGVDIFTTGAVSIVTPQGDTITKTFPTAANGGHYPYRWIIEIRSLLDTGTTVTDANLVILK